MLFNSWQFLVFFPVVCVLYFFSPQRFRLIILLIASFLFYMVFVLKYVLILVSLILIDFFAGKLIEKAKEPKRKIYLLVSLVSNLSILVFFKYINVITNNTLSIILPVGLSFHTFQAMSYTIEVYRKKVKAEKKLLNYALYVMFFPQLVAGPIERPQNLLPQFKHFPDFKYENAVIGLRQMLWGMFKKVVIADRLALYVNIVYDQPAEYQGISLIMATIFFAFQIYCDFSGYSDIAIGAAKVLGFDLMKNFNLPYLAKNISDFWSRWHISLSTWFRDYVYIPLGGNRKYFVRNILVVFVLSGMWHGSSLSFAFWGLLHALYYLLFKIFPKFSNRAVTFGLVCFAWIFFRAKDFNTAIYIATHLTTGIGGYVRYLLSGSVDVLHLLLPFTIFRPYSEFILIIFGLGVLFMVESNRLAAIMKLTVVRWGLYLAAILLILNFGVINEIPFIYFQF